MPRDEVSPASVPGVWLAFFLAAPLFVVAVIACADDEPDTILDVLNYLGSEYSVPIEDAVPPVACHLIDPSTDYPDCAALVVTIEDSNPALDRAIVRLRDIVARANPREVEGIELLNDGIAALVAGDQADELVIDGWKSGDINTWREGWTLREAARSMWIRFVEDMDRFVEESESPSASGQ